MIFSSIHAHDDLKKYPAAIAKAITYLTETDFDNLADGVYEIDGKMMYAQVFTFTSKPASECKPELHRKYLDVQFWISGEEKFGVKNEKEAFGVTVTYCNDCKDSLNDLKDMFS